MKNFLIGCLILFLAACQTATPVPTTFPSPTSTLPPSPIPATLTPVASPTLEPTSTPFPKFFTTVFDDSLTGWVVLQAGNDAVPDVKVEHGRLTLQMDSPYTWLYALYGGQDYSNVRIETQFTNRALTPAAGGVICRYSEEQGWYEFNVLADGTYNVLLGKWLSPGIADYLPITDGTSKAILPSGSNQKVGLVCSGSVLSLYVNDSLIRNINVANYGLSEGKIGLAAASYENTPIVVGFDSVTVGEP